MFERLGKWIERIVLSSAGAVGAGVCGIIVIVCSLTLLNGWAGASVWHIVLGLLIACILGAVYPRYFVGFMTIFGDSEDDSDTSWWQFMSRLGYTLAVIAAPIVFLFRINLLAALVLVLTVQFALTYGLHLYVNKSSRKGIGGVTKGSC